MRGFALLLCFFLVFLVTDALRLPLFSKPTRKLTAMKREITGGTSKVIPLKGNVTYWAGFYIRIALGIPPQNVSLQLDTGSTDLVVYSQDCKNCSGAKSYNYTKSTTAQLVPCTSPHYKCLITVKNSTCSNTTVCLWDATYGDGSAINGFVVEDILTLTGVRSKTPAGFGAIEGLNTDHFEEYGVDGIWGIAHRALSGWGGVPALDVFIKDFGYYNSFSMCLGTERGNGGVLAIGDDYSKDKRIQWTDMIKHKGQYGWYQVYMAGIWIGNTSLGISPQILNKGPVVIDSGTTLIVVPKVVGRVLEKRLLAMCDTTILPGICDVEPEENLFAGYCYEMSDIDIMHFPKLSFSFKGTGRLLLTPYDYLFKDGGGSGLYCLGIESFDDDEIGDFFIFGDVFMQRYHVVFDRVTQRIGFGPLAICPFP